MEQTCNRCHQAVSPDSCYCPSCGLPQLVYSAEAGSVPLPSERWPEAVRDASSIDWKPGMRAAISLAVPAALLSSGVSPLQSLGFLWMAGGAMWAVVLYTRSQRPAWITAGAGARLGLVTGILAGWLTFGITGTDFFLTRVARHQGGQIDTSFAEFVNAELQLSQQAFAELNYSPQQVAAGKTWLLSPEGRAGFITFAMASRSVFLLLFAAAGGAIGARMLARSRRPEV